MPTVLITGANRGLGLEMARQYAGAGWRVVAACRRPAEAKALGTIGGNVAVEALDVEDEASVSALARKFAGETIDLLVNNAGIGAAGRTAFGDIDYADWARLFRVNAMAPLRVAMAFVEPVARSPRRTMLFISTRAGSIHDNLYGGRYLYRSSKAALNMVVKSLAIDLAPRRIVCTAVHPGWVRTDMGGAEAPIDAATAIAALRALVDRLEPHDSGRFLNYDGRELRW
jgi:NAD(P)-dependent dehydrogenase (short-subunit alcohol dehydrogenase family)